MPGKPVAADRTNCPTGWSACDKDGNQWPVSENEALEIEKQRKANNAARGVGETPGT